MYSNEYMLALHGNIISGKLKAKDKTNPIFITSDKNDVDKLIKIFPVNACPQYAIYPNIPTKIYTPVHILTATLIRLFILSNVAPGNA